MKPAISFLHPSRPTIVVVTFTILATAYGAMAQRTTRVAKGEWGGTGALMSVTDSGATIQFDCADATITKQLRVRSAGSFVAEGILMRNGPGPIRADAQGTPVKFHGKVAGQKMTLHMVDAVTGAALGDYTVNLGQATRLHRCY